MPKPKPQSRAYDYRNTGQAKPPMYACELCYRPVASGIHRRCIRCTNELRFANKVPLIGELPKDIPQAARLSKFGLSPAAFKALADEQGGKCAICRTTPLAITALVIDHNHTTDEVRGLLCNACNTGIGLLKDNPKVLQAAVAYLTERGHYGKDPE